MVFGWCLLLWTLVGKGGVNHLGACLGALGVPVAWGAGAVRPAWRVGVRFARDGASWGSSCPGVGGLRDGVGVAGVGFGFGAGGGGVEPRGVGCFVGAFGGG